MTHVQIRNHPENGPGTFQVFVDGHDLTDHILREGFRVDLPEGEWPEDVARVHMVVPADTLDIDLPEAAMVEALRKADAE